MRTLALIHIILGAIAAVFLQGSFLHMLVLVGFSLLVLFPVAAVILIGAVIGTARRGGELPSWIKSAFLAWLVFAGSALFSWVIGVSFHAYHVASVKRYVLRATVILDDIKEQDGNYPQHLPEKLAGSPPLFLQEQGSYQSDGRSFSFQYLDPAYMMDGWVFNSASRTWTQVD